MILAKRLMMAGDESHGGDYIGNITAAVTDVVNEGVGFHYNTGGIYEGSLWGQYTIWAVFTQGNPAHTFVFQAVDTSAPTPIPPPQEELLALALVDALTGEVIIDTTGLEAEFFLIIGQASIWSYDVLQFSGALEVGRKYNLYVT